MITLVSYPRSGNTFLRNVLFEVYGVPSSTFHDEAHGPDFDWEKAPVVKTHLLPDQLPAALLNRPIVYLIRDGRDAVVSLAHHKKALHDPHSTVDQNIDEVIYAAEGSHFAGWSIHVDTWSRRAVIILRFEDLIKDPIGTCEQLRPWLELPEPKQEALPSFEDLKTGRPQYGSGKEVSETNLAPIWFRRGKVGAWRDEMSATQQRLFWHLHGETAERFGYGSFNTVAADHQPSTADARTYRVLFEASKLLEPHRDGVGRYVEEMLKALHDFAPPSMQVDVLLEDQIVPLGKLYEQIDSMKATGRFQMLKGVLSKLLPSNFYHALARSYSTFRRIRKTRLGGAVGAGGNMTSPYDAIWLSLPQHFDRVQHIPYRSLFVVVHDLSHKDHPKHHTPSNVQRCEQAFEYLEKGQNVRYIFVSESTKRIARAHGLDGEVVHEGVDRKRFFPNYNAHLTGLIGERYGLPNGPFILSVSTLEPRKNLKRLLKAYNQLDEHVKRAYPLVLAGRKGWQWKEQGLEALSSEHVRFTGFVREDHLAALYSMAHLFVYPSIYEGFGLPILEAQACGTPVLCSERTSMPEVGGNVAAYFDPEDEESIAQCLKEGLERSDYEAWCSQSMENTWRFSWRTTAERMIVAIQTENAPEA